MPKKDKKAKAAEKKVRVADKQGKKAAQKEKKAKTKGRVDDESDADDVDLDALRAEYEQQQAQFLEITEVSCDAPSARSSSTLTASPANEHELFLFGGEHYNGAVATFFNDLFIYHTARDEWRRVTSPNSPLPRSGHAWCRGGNAGGIYLFGGEFSSPKQGTFYHYNDFWRLDPASREWTRLETRGKSPPARSGHRMTYFKNYILLYGGFQDTSQQTKYLQDLWVYDCQAYVWHNPVLPPASAKPDARSSFSFLPHESGAVLYGGYSRVKASTTSGKQTKGGTQATRTVLKPVVHQDTWFLRVQQPPSDAAAASVPLVRWERRKKPANLPNPSRAGATMAYHKGRGILFGGVHDVEESEEAIDSEFFDTLFAWNVERNRFFPLLIRPPKGRAKPRPGPEKASGGRRDRGRADEAELLRNLAALETGKSVANAEQLTLDPVAREEERSEKAPKPVSMQLPHRRFNAQLAVQDDSLYIYGGTFESGDREYTFDDMWAINLGRLDGVTEIFRREPENWQGDEDEMDEDDEEEDDDDDDDEGDSPDEDEDMVSRDGEDAERLSTTTAATSVDTETRNAPTADESSETATPASALGDSLPHPRPFESLRDFFTRTSLEWQEVHLQRTKVEDSVESRSAKEIKKAAFDRAEEKWWDCREEVRALEDEQEEAGIGDVISLADRAGVSGGGGGDGIAGAGPGGRRR
ncbi:MAG: hypothetical protein M1838_002081 [Thelocarpon superellum]|nr:MAG: hypothetical protein M1838_002081 [Thelocarpon superellum]